ncbi:MAG: RNase J family beta-CASP ribonuclease, partial [Oscillospiraceae bacterium]
LGVGDVSTIVLRDRKHLSQDGLIIVVATIDSATGTVVAGPDIVSRGFVYVRESEEIMSDIRNIASKCLEDCTKNGVREWGNLKQKVKEDINRYVYSKTKRNPMILPVIQEI